MDAIRRAQRIAYTAGYIAGARTILRVVAGVTWSDAAARAVAREAARANPYRDDAAFRLVRDAWGTPSVAETVLQRLILALKPGATARLPAPYVYKIAGAGAFPPPREIIEVVEWFTASQCTLFEQRFQLYFPNGEEFVLTEEEVREVLHHRVYVHPRTGAELPIDAKGLFPFFVGNAVLDQLLREHQLQGGQPA